MNLQNQGAPALAFGDCWGGAPVAVGSVRSLLRGPDPEVTRPQQPLPQQSLPAPANQGSNLDALSLLMQMVQAVGAVSTVAGAGAGNLLGQLAVLQPARAAASATVTAAAAAGDVGARGARAGQEQPPPGTGAVTGAGAGNLLGQLAAVQPPRAAASATVTAAPAAGDAEAGGTRAGLVPTTQGTGAVSHTTPS